MEIIILAVICKKMLNQLNFINKINKLTMRIKNI